MKARLLISFLATAVIAYAASPASRNSPFSMAGDFPRGALVYVQVSDLPGFIRLWNGSNFKNRYFASRNFKDFSNSHLGLKLAGRWQEFNDAAGFTFDLETLSGLAEGRAAVAFYDVGKLDFVFIAPVSDAVFAATRLLQNGDRFVSEDIDNGLRIYRVDVDRGRQKQQLLFTNYKGRLIVATSEKLLARTISNIDGSGRKDKLADEPSFSALSQHLVPHLATVWVDQKSLNDDYYFKHYFLMQPVDRLKDMQAGIFDLALEEGKVIEHRRFLLNAAAETPTTKATAVSDMQVFVPDDVPFFRIRNAGPKAVSDSLRQILDFDRSDTQGDTVRRRSYQTFEFAYTDYRSSDENFDERVDEDDDQNTSLSVEPAVDISGVLQSARPETVLTFVRPEVKPIPLFAEFQRGVVVRFSSPERFDSKEFESVVARHILRRLTLGGDDLNLGWQNVSENGNCCRRLELPMLGWSIAYAVRGNYLFVANNSDLLSKVLAGSSTRASESSTSPAAELIVLKPAMAQNSYYQIFARLTDEEDASDDFFTGNVASLVDSVGAIEKIAIERNYQRNFLEEEIKADLAR